MNSIVAIVGSPRSNSKTYEIVEKLFNVLETDEEILFNKNIIALSDYKINSCKGCFKCFKECRICGQYNDDLVQIENSILEADIVIFASPVYAHNIPGIMKNFIDRLSYGLHIMRFIGRYGITISVSASNGNKFVNDYLQKMFTYFGIKTVDNCSFQLIHGIDEERIKECANSILGIMKNTGGRKATEYENMVFDIMKTAMNEVRAYANTPETDYWSEHKFFEYDNFEELFLEERKNANII